MRRPSNQTIERYYFELFKKHYALPEGDIEFTDKPDVIIRGDQTTGIEIANLYITSGATPASEQVQRARRLQVLEKAQALHRASGGRSTELSVDFRPEKPIQQVEPIARELAKLALSIQEHPSGQVSPMLFEHVPELRFLYYNDKEYEDAKWQPVQGYDGVSLSLEQLREVINDKARKVPAYQSCDLHWLLLIVDYMDSAQDQDINWPQGASLAISPFERVILFKPQFGQVVHVPK